MTIWTDRDFCHAVCELEDRHQEHPRTLELYLLALLRLARQYCGRTYLMPSEFVDLLAGAFVVPPLPFEPAWRSDYDVFDSAQCGFALWEGTLICQIVDLREMDEAGILAGEWIGVGVKAPRGENWYNFHPCLYLDCAMDGSLVHWDPDTAANRSAVLTGNHPIFEIPPLSWDQLTDFIVCGQIYE